MSLMKRIQKLCHQQFMTIYYYRLALKNAKVIYSEVNTIVTDLIFWGNSIVDVVIQQL